MRPSLRAALLVGVVTLALVLAGCHAPAPTEAPSHRFQTDDFSFSGPDELPAGWVEIVLEHGGMAPHHIQLFRLEEGRTMSDLLADLNGTHAVPDWATPVGGPNPPVPGGTSSAWVHLEAGEHAMLCMIPDGEGVPHFAHGMAKSVRVVDEENEGEPPEADLTVKLKDYAFDAGTWTPGERVVEVVNEGGEPHELVLVRYHEDGDFQALLEAFGPNATGPPPADFQGGVSAISVGATQLFPVTLTPGRYGFICFLEAEGSGAPHFALGMEETFEVA